MNRKSLLIVILILFMVVFLSADGAIIMENTGTVLVQSSGETTRAETGRNLKSGDVVTTGEKGSVLILLSDGTRIDLFSHSRVLISKNQKENGNDLSFLGKLWKSIKGKFSDVEYTSAQTGTVGALRASVEDESNVNDILSDKGKNELNEILSSIVDEELPKHTSEQMKAIIYEEYGQFVEAEKIYLNLIEEDPQDLILYDMIIDLYLKIDFYGHASKMIGLKKEISETL